MDAYKLPHGGSILMSKHSTRYLPEFKERMVALLRSGRSVGEWVQQADRYEGKRTDGLTTVETNATGQLPQAICGVLVLVFLGACGSDAAGSDAVTDTASVTDTVTVTDTAQVTDTVTDTAPTPAPWRTSLYPPDWKPGFALDGQALHDFSWAGYHNGDVALPQTTAGKTYDVVKDFNADSTGGLDATTAMQAAIDAAAKEGGGTVYIPPGTFRCDGVLSIQSGAIVLRGDGPSKSRIRFTSHKDMAHKAHITIGSAPKATSEHLLAVDATSLATVVEVGDAGELAPGDDVDLGWVISEEFIAEHGMKGTWKAFNGTWQPFFRRDVVAVDKSVTPHLVTLDVPLRYPAKVRDKASLKRTTGWLREVGVQSVGLANAVSWTDAWSHNQVQLLALRGVADGWVRDVHSFAPPQPAGGYMPDAHVQSGGILVQASKRVTIADCQMSRAQHRGGGGNGYLFQLRTSSEILTRDCVGKDGRHNFIQNWGFGLTGCVWLRIDSRDGKTMLSPKYDIGGLGYSEFHHSLATANLVDSSRFDDGWASRNRHDWSTGAGQTATENVLWNIRGSGRLVSYNWGHGYVIGTGPELEVKADLPTAAGEGTAPADRVEGLGEGGSLVPQSLYEDQLQRRLAP